MDFKTKTLEVSVITLSDRAAAGTYTDRSGPIIEQLIQEHFAESDLTVLVKRHLIPDDAIALRAQCATCNAHGTDVIFTTGGTGVGPRDITIETVRPLLDKEIPGIMEHIRWKYGQQNPNALLSRSIAGVVGNTQVYCLPGSPRAATEYTTEILKTMEHLVYMIHGIDRHH